MGYLLRIADVSEWALAPLYVWLARVTLCQLDLFVDEAIRFFRKSR